MYTNLYDEIYDKKIINSDETRCNEKINNDYKCRYSIRLCKSLKNSHEKLQILDRNCEYKVDFILENIEYLKIEGKVFDSSQQIVEGAVVTLYKFNGCSCSPEEIAVCDGITDCQGDFIFLIPQLEKDISYRVKVNQNVKLY